MFWLFFIQLLAVATLSYLALQSHHYFFFSGKMKKLQDFLFIHTSIIFWGCYETFCIDLVSGRGDVSRWPTYQCASVPPTYRTVNKNYCLLSIWIKVSSSSVFGQSSRASAWGWEVACGHTRADFPYT